MDCGASSSRIYRKVNMLQRMRCQLIEGLPSPALAHEKSQLSIWWEFLQPNNRLMQCCLPTTGFLLKRHGLTIWNPHGTVPDPSTFAFSVQSPIHFPPSFGKLRRHCARRSCNCNKSCMQKRGCTELKASKDKLWAWESQTIHITTNIFYPKESHTGSLHAEVFRSVQLTAYIISASLASILPPISTDVSAAFKASQEISLSCTKVRHFAQHLGSYSN